MATLDILSEFPPVSSERWEQAIREDLKGADCADKLIWHAAEGIDVKPYYRAEDLSGLEFLGAAPGDFPYTRGTRRDGDWRIREEIKAVDAEEANGAARRAVAGGADEIAFCGVELSNTSDLAILLADLGGVPVHFARGNRTMIRLLVERLNKYQRAVSVSAGLDWSEDLDVSAEVMATAPAVLAPFTIHAEEFQDSGATAVEEVGFGLAAGVDFVAAMQERGVDVDRVSGAIIFGFAMGPDFLMQVAKLRAFRMLWAQAMASFGASGDKGKARIYARTSSWNRTVYDPHVNMLRGTTEAISAAWGGAESIYVAPFDACFTEPGEVSRRLARNTQIILKQEALFSRVADPMGGSYCVEKLTDLIARKAWTVLQEIEAAGGYRAAAAGGMIARTLEKRNAAQERAVGLGRRVLTGVNRFADASETVIGGIDVARVRESRRAAMGFERLRLRTERHAIRRGKKPRVLLAEIGDAKIRSARSGFAADFLACAGIETFTQRFQKAGEIAAIDADMIVLCSSDAEYAALADELLPVLRSRGGEVPVVVAGNPESVEQLKRAGVAEFIHLKSDPIEVLTKLQLQLGNQD